jgi:hypothetical protein
MGFQVAVNLPMRFTRTAAPQLASERSFTRRQRLRFVLDMLQMFGVVFAPVLILETGRNKLSLAATVLTCADRPRYQQSRNQAVGDSRRCATAKSRSTLPFRRRSSP